MPQVGLEPTRPQGRGILSAVRLPFRHWGSRHTYSGAIELRQEYIGQGFSVRRFRAARLQIAVSGRVYPRFAPPPRQPGDLKRDNGIG